MEREKLEKLGEHLDNIQTGIRAIKTELNSIAKESLWDSPDDVEDSLGKFDELIQDRLDELDDELAELDEEKE